MFSAWHLQVNSSIERESAESLPNWTAKPTPLSSDYYAVTVQWKVVYIYLGLG